MQSAIKHLTFNQRTGVMNVIQCFFMLEYFLNAYFCPVFIPTAEREKRQEKEDKRQSSKKGIRK